MKSRLLFGQFLRELREKRGISLRRFCQENGFDPGNWSKLERGLQPPPFEQSRIEEYARALGVKPDSEDWSQLLDLSYLSRGEIPAGVLSDDELMEKLPLLFRTRTGDPVDPDKLDKLINLIRKS